MADLTADRLRWFALRVKARHEKSAAHLLESMGYELFCPTYRKRHSYGVRVREFQLPLFAGYVFCRLDVLNRLPVLKTPGVVDILGFGRTPAPIDNDEIYSLQTVVKAQLSLVPYPFPSAGETVRITQGPFSGLVGTVVRVKDSLRIVLSISLLKRSVLVEVESKHLLPEDAAVEARLHAA